MCDKICFHVVLPFVFISEKTFDVRFVVVVIVVIVEEMMCAYKTQCVRVRIWISEIVLFAVCVPTDYQ